MEPKAEIRKYLNDLCIEVVDEEIKKLLQYLELLYQGNKLFNLTGTKDKQQILIRHIFDSLGIFKFFRISGIEKSGRLEILDIGTGPGLPGIPVAVFLNNSEIFLMDSKGKAAAFLGGIIENLELSNCSVLMGRAEVIGHDKNYRERFDIVTARAVADVGILSEITIPFCKVGGRVVLYKSRKLSVELNKAEAKINMLGAKVEDIVEVKIPLLDEYRALLILKKEFPTLYKYPRKYDRMLKMPNIV